MAVMRTDGFTPEEVAILAEFQKRENALSDFKSLSGCRPVVLGEKFRSETVYRRHTLFATTVLAGYCRNSVVFERNLILGEYDLFDHIARISVQRVRDIASSCCRS